MALGGGTFTVQNKVLPGAYINFISTGNNSSVFSDRGVCFVPLNFNWCKDNEIFEVSSEDFEKNCLNIFGYSYTDDKVKFLRDLFKNASSCLFYRLSGGDKATNDIATAKYSGTRGNDIFIKISKNIDDESKFDFYTYLKASSSDGSSSNILVDTQTVKTTSELVENDFVTFKAKESISETTGTFLTGGTDGEVTTEDYQKLLDNAEGQYFNILICDSTNDLIKGLFANFTKRIRDNVGIKFQTIIFDYKADYEGVINFTTEAKEDKLALIYWLAGNEASCAVNKTITNKQYDGEFTPICADTQKELETAIQNGELKIHKVGDEFRVLTDISSLTTYTEDKNSLFSSNQTVRVCDQIATDIAKIFNNYYLGKVPNDAGGRISLWNEIVKYHNQLEDIRAIEAFDKDALIIKAGDTKKGVIVNESVTPINCMEQLYMTVKVL